jgi:hypothetical protein
MATQIPSSRIQRPTSASSGVDPFEAFARASQERFALPEVPQVDPRDAIVKQLYEYTQGQVPPMELAGMTDPSARQLEVPQPDVTLNDQATPANLATATGTPLAYPKQMGYTEDAEGNVVYDESGRPVPRVIPMSEQASTQAQQLSSLPNVSEGLSELSKEYPDYIKSAKDIMQSKNESMQLGSARYTEMGIGSESVTTDDFDHWANSAGPTLQAKAIKDTDMMLNTKSAYVRTADGAYPQALRTLFDEGITNLDELNKAIMLTGIAHSAAVSQSAVMRGDTKEIPADINGRPITDSDFLRDRIDSQVHFMRNAFKNAGMNISENGMRQLADAYQISKLKAGDDIMYFDKRNRPVIVSSPESKKESRTISYLTEALTGDNKRLLASSTPVPAGTNFVAGKPLTTARSLEYGEMITAAADATKDILGRVAYQFNKKDIDYKTFELQLIMSEAIRDPGTNKFLYSTHYLADRNGLAKKHYEAARVATKPKEDYNPADPSTGPIQESEFETAKDRQAADTMNNKLISYQFDLLNAQKLPGLRFSAWMHSVANQRFFPASGGTDYMSSKNVVRDMMNFGAQDVVTAEHLFDKTKVDYLKEVGNRILFGKKSGQEINKALKALPPTDLAAIGMMINAVINYETAIKGGNPQIIKTGMADILSMYTPQIGARLAEVGKEYNAFMSDPQSASDNIKQLLAGMERGESMGNKNLWDDFFELQNKFNNPNKQMKSQNHKISHLTFDDGNQNGIFLQALFSGNTPQAIQLGTFNPSMEDLRTFALSSLHSKIDELLPDDSDQFRNGWKEFFKAIIDKHGKAKVASMLLKSPLMQASYGKDASMFSSHVEDFLTEQVAEEYAKYIGPAYDGEKADPQELLNNAVESTLRDILDGGFSTQMKSVGRYMSILGAVPTFAGITGDTQIFSTPGVMPKYAGDSDVLIQEQVDGEKIILKRKAIAQSVYNTLEGKQIEIEQTMRGYDPNATKGLQRYWNKRTQQWDFFDNPIGSAQGRLLNVMPIQSADGDLVKLTTMFVNSNRNELPKPISWVHDSIISTASGSLIYRNAYNNYAIPAAIPAIAKFAGNIDSAWNTAEKHTFRQAEKAGIVGIGDNGDYPSLGAFFDEIHNKYSEGSSYKEFFLRRSGNDEIKWNKKVADANKVLSQAKSFGWKPPFSISGNETHSGEAIRADIAVSAEQFKQLAMLAKKTLGLVPGVSEHQMYPYTRWLREFPSKVEETAKVLMKAAQPHGIGQMTPTGGASRYKGDVSNDSNRYSSAVAERNNKKNKKSNEIKFEDIIGLENSYASKDDL